MPGAEPIRHDGGPVAALLLHGFTSTPASMSEWAQALADDGLTVAVPRLPGHGTTWREMNTTRWPDWYAEVEHALLDLSEQHEKVFVGGLSMGGALALRLAVHHPEKVAGLMLVNPCVSLTDRREFPTRSVRMFPLPVLRHLVPGLTPIASDIRKQGVVEVAYPKTPLHALHSATHLFRDVKASLPQVTAPLLMMRSKVDHVVPTSSGKHVLDRVSSTDVTDLTLHDSFHVATMDEDAPLIFARSTEFVRRVANEVAA
jgi:carboxylesterase